MRPSSSRVPAGARSARHCRHQKKIRRPASIGRPARQTTMQTKLPRGRRASALAATLAAAFSGSAFALNPSDTSVQMFEWSWNDLATECTQFLGPQGYGGIQISPPGAAKLTGNWWDVYQPVNYVALTSKMGTQAQLQSMINTC